MSHELEQEALRRLSAADLHRLAVTKQQRETADQAARSAAMQAHQIKDVAGVEAELRRLWDMLDEKDGIIAKLQTELAKATKSAGTWCSATADARMEAVKWKTTVSTVLATITEPPSNP